MSEKLEYEAPQGKRIARYFTGVTHFAPKTAESLWWFPSRRCWDVLGSGDPPYSTHAPCRTLKAFRRHLKKHSNLLGEVVLVNQYIGFNVTVWRDSNDG